MYRVGHTDRLKIDLGIRGIFDGLMSVSHEVAVRSEDEEPHP